MILRCLEAFLDPILQELRENFQEMKARQDVIRVQTRALLLRDSWMQGVINRYQYWQFPEGEARKKMEALHAIEEERLKPLQTQHEELQSKINEVLERARRL